MDPSKLCIAELKYFFELKVVMVDVISAFSRGRLSHDMRNSISDAGIRFRRQCLITTLEVLEY